MIFWAFKRFWVFGLAVAVLLCSFAGISNAQDSVCFGASCFYPEVAETAPQKQKGLMGRESLAENEGMFFVYDEDVRPAFWMKNMRIALDFVWIDREGRVVDIHQGVPPCGQNCPSIVSRQSLRYVLEVPSGAVEKAGIKIGDQALIKLGETK